MNRWGIFFFDSPPPFASPAAWAGLPGLCNLSVSTSFCKADSIKITPVAERESDRGQFDFADWLLCLLFFQLRLLLCLPLGGHAEEDEAPASPDKLPHSHLES